MRFFYFLFFNMRFCVAPFRSLSAFPAFPLCTASLVYLGIRLCLVLRIQEHVAEDASLGLLQKLSNVKTWRLRIQPF
ncbi:hypothetical protein QL093DRAFT_2309138 [Fusarium oxysporum]|nr:hypothetical protein QL093DRAFT_2309138 [Fusarium oxysporum]